MAAPRLTLTQRKQVFRDLVARQDEGESVSQSYAQMVKLHSISEEQLRRIEEEGISNDWPPFNQRVTRAKS